MTSSKTKKRSQPSVRYQPVEDTNGSVESAFDLLFEETLLKYGDLTTGDN